MSSSKQVLFQSTTVKDTINMPPVVIIGLPRSGSSFLAHVTSHIKDWFIFDDLYLYRKARSIGAVKSHLTKDQLHQLVDFLGWQIRARIKFGVFCVPKMSLEDVDLMNQALIDTFSQKDVYWHELQAEWMSRLALNQGAKFWGYKAPQDFQITELLDAVYPQIKYIFLYRDPRKMLRSFKFVRDQDGEPHQYHPIIYSLYWKKAIAAMESLSASKKARLLQVKYEELAADPEAQALRIAEFLGTSLSSGIDTSHTNTSFSTKKSADITGLEKKICDYVTSPFITKLGYVRSSQKVAISDYFDLIRSSFTFFSFQIKRFSSNKSARVSIYMYLKTLIAK